MAVILNLNYTLVNCVLEAMVMEMKMRCSQY
jgi:hypothetical protein